MSNRNRNLNRIRGPHSALTDFLAANNISAGQIRDDYQRRLQQAQQREEQERIANGETATVKEEDEEMVEAEDEIVAESSTAARARGRRATDDAAAAKKKAQEEKAIAKIKKSKEFAKRKAAKKLGDDDDENDDYNDEDDDFLAREMYKKAKAMPGQLDNCEICNKRFTVTPYSKTGPDGGLLCTPCGKNITKDDKSAKKPQKKPAGRKRRKLESDKLDGLASRGPKTLQQLCIEKVVTHHDELDELGDLPQPVLERLSEIFTKKRVMNSQTLPLFLRPDLDAVIIHDAAYLETEDYQQIFAVIPHIENIVLKNACQFKDENISYIVEKANNLKHLKLYAANLVSEEGWIQLIKSRGAQLESLKLQWLDQPFSDIVVFQLSVFCKNLTRLKFKLCRSLTEVAINALAEMCQLEHLSLQATADISSPCLINLIKSIGPNLRTLSLEDFSFADDEVLNQIHESCTELRKLRFTNNDNCTDAAYATLFTNWPNPPLRFVDFNSTRDIDNSNPHGPADAVGLADKGLKALMAHSGAKLETVDLASCRHISKNALHDVFDGVKQYPELREVNLSFMQNVDQLAIVGIFKSSPALKKLIAFGCFNVEDVVVPAGIVLIGIPRAQDAIEQVGEGWVSVENALGAMVQAAA
ncbi:RNI-like protein [Patellaria atrata CBS 101060]|uniref:RNI-like protein n=1 Tax=Patellaria atrata CBS 101060 TaxID=1346257 RepID=A0A9P4VNC3_9PEZI|nr:RNI-like protein [Patellaria atrata CBS 101060]